MGEQAHGYKAWLVRWEWAGDHAKVADPIIAILSPHTGSSDVKKFVERYHAAVSYSVSERLAFMRRPLTNPYKAKAVTIPVVLEDGSEQQIPWDGEVVCGHNPYIVASRVANLRVIDEGKDTEHLEWDDLPRPHVDLRRSAAH